MPITQSDIDNLNSAISGGEKIVRIGDKWVEYRSVDQLIKARDDLVRQFNLQQTQKKNRLFYVSQSSRGF